MRQSARILRRGQPAGAASITAAFAPWAKAEHWLFVSPHDDDVLIGAGLWVQALLAARAAVSVAIVTDGAMGYTDAKQRLTIAATRAAEAQSAYAKLGVKSIAALGFPDGSLAQHAGSRLVGGQPVGLECALTRLLRDAKPTRVVTTDASDWHPDHRATFEGVRMAIFHACATIWPELGAPLPAAPQLLAFPVYAPLAADPDWMIEASPSAKIEALGEFASQQGIIAGIKATAGNEYLRRVPTEPFDPAAYRSMFAQ